MNLPAALVLPAPQADGLAAGYLLLVTGWREWPEHRRTDINDALDQILDGLLRGVAPAGVKLPDGWPGTFPGPLLTVMHGDSPGGGVDRYADQWGHGHPDEHIAVTRQPADTARFGAGPGRFLRRNSHMVARLKTHTMSGGPGSWLAFPGNSNGTIDCLNKAIRAGIPGTTIPYTE